jgi:hypothetical protein
VKNFGQSGTPIFTSSRLVNVCTTWRNWRLVKYNRLEFQLFLEFHRRYYINIDWIIFWLITNFSEIIGWRW